MYSQLKVEIQTRKEIEVDSLNKLHVNKRLKSEGSNNGNSHTAAENRELLLDQASVC